jgi:predicted dehydrogenase
MSKVKVSVIGTGHLGTIHTKLWSQNEFAELIGIYDVNDEKATQLANEYKIKKFNSIDELLEESQAVTIAAPTSLHYDISKQCIKKGVHCLIEKPITSTSIEAKELIQLAEENQVLVQVGHVERFNPALMAIKNYNPAPIFVEAHRLAQFKPRAIDVSVVLDLMIHDIDIVLWLIKSEVESVYANGVGVLTDTPDIANARITFKNGAVCNLTASRITAKPMRKMRIFQKNAYISVDFGKQDVEVFRLLGENEEMNKDVQLATMLGTIEAGLKNANIVFEKPIVKEINAIAEEQTAFARAILDNSPVAVSAKEATEALRIAELISDQINEQLAKVKGIN